MENRIEFLEKSLAERPGEPFLRYALAMELANSGKLAEAWKHFETLLANHSDYAATYYQAGMLLERLGRREDAKQVLSRGLEVTARQGDQHARSELEAALQDLE